MKETSQIVIAGAGGIGRAVALMLADHYGDALRIYIGDQNPKACESAIQWIRSGKVNPEHIRTFNMPAAGSHEEMDSILKSSRIVLDCLPGTQAPRIATLARQFNLHYVNLTE